MTDEWVDQVENYLKVVALAGQPEELKENPKYRYRQKDKTWFRRCHRCDYMQDATDGTYFTATSHMCMRDSTVKFVVWS